MESFTEVLERYLNRLATNDVNPSEKPSAFVHGMLTTALLELKRIDSERAALLPPSGPLCE